MSFQKQTVGQLAQRHNNAERFALRIQNPSQSNAFCPGQALHQSTKLLILALRLPRERAQMRVPRNTKAWSSLWVRVLVATPSAGAG